MAQITAGLVKELRDKTGAGMMDCKKALGECDGNVEEAVDWLRKNGLSKAAKKSGRVAAEGLIGIAGGENCASLVEINSETDFVSRNELFQEFVTAIAGLSLANDGDIDAVQASGYPDTERNVAEQLTHNISTIGENMNIRRMASLSVDEGMVSSYVHNAVAADLGKIGVLVGLQSSADKDALNSLGKQLAMHIAATNPQSLTVEDLDPALVEREKSVQWETARASGKPDNIIEKMIDGRMRKYYEEVVLNNQVSVIDGERKISEIIADASKELGTEVTLTGFVRFQLGEGIEKEESDFAAEVAQAVGG
ncbi:MAG: elongation factor Ts [Sphingomonadales bacterium]|nr:elongation factor Ts [Sphingomonadales bacterium]